MLEKILPLPGGEGRGEGEREIQLNSSGLVLLESLGFIARGFSHRISTAQWFRPDDTAVRVTVGTRFSFVTNKSATQFLFPR